MKLKLACADYSFPLLTHDKALDLVALLDFSAINIGIFAGRSHLTPEEIMPDIAGAARNLSQKLNDRGLDFADIFYQAATFEDRAANHPDEGQRQASRDFFQRMTEFALHCNAPHITGLPGIHWEDESLETSLKRCADELAWRVEYAKQAGITYSIEPHLGSVVATPTAVHSLLQLTPGLTLTLDYGHFIYQGIANKEIEPLTQHASHFHARCAAKGQLQALFQDNGIDFVAALGGLQRNNYNGYVEIEYVWIDWEGCNQVDNISETIQLRDFLESIS
jgi:sugar phosphate isomerase/epimerase